MKTITKILTLLIFVSVITNAQGKLSLGFNGGLSSPGGDFGDIYKGGFGASGILSYNLSDNILLSGSVGYYSMNVDNEKIKSLTEGSGDDINVDAPLTIIPIMAGAKYLFATGQFMPYVSLELGVHSMSINEASAVINGEKMIFAKSVSQTKTAWALGGGAYVNLSDNLALEISAKYNGNGAEAEKSSITTSGNTVTTESSSSTLTFLTIFAGINFAL